MFEVFICGYLLVLIFILALRKKPFRQMVFALFLFILGMLLFDWNTFSAFLLSGEPSIRGSQQVFDPSLLSCLKNSLIAFIFGQYHSASSHTFVVLPVCCLFFLYINLKYIRNKSLSNILHDPFNWLFTWCVFNALIYGINEWVAFKEFVNTFLPPLKGFSFARTLWFNGFIWYFMFAIVLIRMSKSPKKFFKTIAKTLLALAVICVVCIPQTYNHIQMQIKNTILQASGQPTDLSYREFYSQSLFDEIKKDLNYQGEWSIAVGFHPSILQYNQIATLDGYLSTYPQYYKDQFAQLIEPELKQNSTAYNSFMNVGIRAYVFNAELPYDATREKPTNSILLRIDPDVFENMNGTYIFSRAEISNYSELNLSFKDTYSSPQSPYCIYVYQIRNKSVSTS